ncbi:MAG: Stk1 family PASTA domain-containing Ser/Thr kinase [Clostridia bacterium]|nr:Stk1 family PASTA domain-containing Ser/Thr kinase [Clostridia bacterium]
MDKYIGKVLDGRYEILEVLGVGGMSVVYKAHCNRLNRFVAIKILKEEYFADKSLRKQFHDESQSVAILSHPNIVSVYDVSHFEDTEYIVMELIDGITLKEYLQRRSPLPWKEVTFFALQIAKALEHAHSRNIIHRDIKPQNMMLLRDGTLKVTDFGIAKNMVSQGTIGLGEAIGSVHYVSPEQAKGSLIDARSDLYSFGIVMYEMLTGRLPFEGDNPVSVAIQHINSMALPPSDFVDNIPTTLETITMKAMNPSLARRYTSAGEIIHDLECFRSDPHFTLPLDISQTHGAAAADDNTDKDSDKSDGAADDTSQTDESVEIVIKNEKSAAAKEKDAKKSSAKGKKAKYVSKGDARRKVNNKTQATKNRKKSAKRPKYNWNSFVGTIIFMLIAILIFVGGAMLFILKVIDPFGSPNNSKISVPKLVGLYYDEVVNSLEYYEYNIVAGEYLYSEEYAEGQIISQTPEANRSVSSKQEIVVDISRGGRSFSLDDYSGKEHHDVEIELRHKGVTTVLEGIFNDQYPAGQVVYTSPVAGSTVLQNDTVTVYYSLGSAADQTTVPNIVGIGEYEALEALDTAGLIAGTPLYMPDEAPKGQIIYQTIAPESKVARGTIIIYHVSTGPNGGNQPTDKGYGVSTDPYPDDPIKRKINYTVVFIEADAEINVTVKVNSYVEYEGIHYYSEGHIVVPLTAYEGYNNVTVIQNGKTVSQESVNFK